MVILQVSCELFKVHIWSCSTRPMLTQLLEICFHFIDVEGSVTDYELWRQGTSFTDIHR